MWSFVVGWGMRRVIDQLNRGQVDRVLWFFAADATFEFPGDNTWSGTRSGRTEIRDWLTRFVETGLQLQVEDVVTSGPPWNQRIATRFCDRLLDDDGQAVYENEGVLYDRLRWGRIVRHESFEDTEAVSALDRHLAAREAARHARPDSAPGPRR